MSEKSNEKQARIYDPNKAPSPPPTVMTSKLPPIVTQVSQLEHKHNDDEPTPTDLWGPALGHNPRNCNDPLIRAFRLAVGVPHIRPTQATVAGSDGVPNLTNPGETDPCRLEEGLFGGLHGLPSLHDRRANAVGLYQLVLKAQRRKDRLHSVMDVTLYFLYVIQVVFGAALTALGPVAGGHPAMITVLGAANTVIAALLALIKGQSLPERFRKDEMEFRKVRDFIEETEALLVAGIAGRDLEDVGRLVETTFKMYNAAKENEENNRPGSYARNDKFDKRYS